MTVRAAGRQRETETREVFRSEHPQHPDRVYPPRRVCRWIGDQLAAICWPLGTRNLDFWIFTTLFANVRQCSPMFAKTRRHKTKISISERLRESGIGAAVLDYQRVDPSSIPTGMAIAAAALLAFPENRIWPDRRTLLHFGVPCRAEPRRFGSKVHRNTCTGAVVPASVTDPGNMLI